MPVQSTSPITRRIISVFLLSSALFFVLTTFARLAFEYQDTLQEARRGLDKTMQVMVGPSGRALWNFDMKQLEAEAGAATGLPIMVKVEVLDDRGQVVVSRVKPGAPQLVEEVVSRPIPGVDQTGVIGTLKIYVSYAPLRQEFWHRAGHILLTDFLAIAALAVLLFYLLHRFVIVHLLQMAHAVEKLEPAGPAQPLVLKRGPHAPDEIDQLAEAINTFHREIVEERRAREQMEQQSRNLGGELARMGRVATVQSLTTTIAHELNQPLGAILSNAETIELTMLEHLPADDPLREVLADIASEARRAGDIIRNLRNLMEKRDIDMAMLELNPLVRQVVDLVSLDTRWESISIESELAENLLPVMGSAVQLQQVILNLVANARDAIQQAGVACGVITISTQQDDARWLHVVVTDNGPGIAPEKISYILQPFFTTKQGGTGMGLWIAQMIIEQHGGKLEVGNVAAGGACFSFSLPVQS